MRILVALGGNALLKRGEPMTHARQRANVAKAAAVMARVIEAGHDLVITHGNGPQVGLLALQSAAGPKASAQPLDVLDAESEGMIGYLIERELRSRLPGREIATLLTQVRVDGADPSFAAPTKPIGPTYSESAARELAAANDWTIAPDGHGWRRVVASPEPVEVLEARAIGLLLAEGVIAICAGGGGIPVVRQVNGWLTGIEGVIDKDASSALLAQHVGADLLILATDVEGLFEAFGTPRQRLIPTVRAHDLTLDDLPAGSMRPKAKAAADFVRATGRSAVIGALDDVEALAEGARGTRFLP
ncbi:carbamate kinase [Acidimangrovimonas sediminis]|uniref:carbamate kinase n=1 Tax=Acidimangrovimonas sediminis TaxID=2056283 RepID=UPI000C7FEB61|nr:carbamate kinase [Acidimangrovimonas sediminis]